jgi:ribosomal protein S11
MVPTAAAGTLQYAQHGYVSITMNARFGALRGALLFFGLRREKSNKRNTHPQETQAAPQMTASEVAKELARALGVEEVTIQIRQTSDKKASVIDAVRLFLGLDANQAAERVRQICERYPEVKARICIYKFPGRRQRDTPIADLATLYEILMLLPGRMAAQSRRQAAQLMIRYLGGDLSLIAEVEENRKLQERLAAEDPNHPLRQFGVAVEAATEPNATEVVHPQDTQADPKGDFLYGMKVPGGSTALKVGRTKDIAQRERALSCGQVEPVRAIVVFPGAGPLEKYVHRRLRRQQIQNEVFQITVQELKDTVLLAREDFAREQNLEELRMQMSSPNPVDDDVEDLEDVEPTSNKRRRLLEDLDLEERQVALEHTKAMNTLEIREREVRLDMLALEIEERRARLYMEMQERAAKLSLDPLPEPISLPARLQVDPDATTTATPAEPLTTAIPKDTKEAATQWSLPDSPDAANTRDVVAQLLGTYELVKRSRDATSKSNPELTHRMKQANMGLRKFNQALRKTGLHIAHSGRFLGVRKGKLWVRLQ